MTLSGLSDSIASVIADPAQCPHCDSSSHIAGGLCVGCLLQAGLEPDDECAPESLVSALAEISLPDKNWRLGNYEILEEIGRGGMGVIYRARQRHSRRIVAVKRVLSYHSDSRETLARFRREAQAAASLDHPNILPIYEVSESEDGLPFFSMKFAPGGNLQEVGPALRNDPRQCVALVAKVARAVQYAHAKGILHRDLKPGNILLDARGEPLVSDFGLAKWLDTTSELTRTLTIFGTPGYIAPEQATGPAADLKPSADVYSLGAILFDLLAGRPPFLGAHALSVIRQAAESPAPKLRTLSKIADRDLETICAHCLERDRNARYRSAHDLAEDLERWLQGRPIIARPVLPPVRIWRWSKRNLKLALSLAAVALLGIVGFITALTSSRLSSIVAQAEIARHSVAVAPFEDLNQLSNGSTSAEAITSSLTTLLKSTKGVHATSLQRDGLIETDPWSTHDWKRIGVQIQRRFILTGTVRPREGKERVTIRLIESATGLPVAMWHDDIAPSGDATQSLGKQITQMLLAASPSRDETSQVIVGPQGANGTGGTSNITARSYYERGKEFLFRYNLTDQARAIESFRTAVEIDPRYAQAYALLATACQLRALVFPNEPWWLTEAETAVNSALRIAPLLPEAHIARADILRNHGNLRASIDAYLTGYELDPANGRAAAKLGALYLLIGRPDLAISWFERASRRENRPIYADNIGAAWLTLGDYDKAEEAYRTSSVFQPDLPLGALGLTMSAMLRGDYDRARQLCQEARSKHKDHPQPAIMAAVIEFFSRNFNDAEKLYRAIPESSETGGVDFFGCVRFVSALGFIQLANGHASEGRALVEQACALDEKESALNPENPVRLYSLAADRAVLGQEAESIAALERAVAAGWINHRSLELDPRFDSLRQNRVFQNILTRLSTTVEEMRRSLPSRKLASKNN